MERSSSHDPLPRHHHHHHHHLKCPSQRLENIKEEDGDWLPAPAALRPPETPTETMEFLARSWSLSAFDLSRALGDALNPHPTGDDGTCPSPSAGSAPAEKIPSTALQPVASAEPFVISPPISPRDTADLKLQLLRGATRGKTKGGWLRDHQDRKRAEARSHKAQAYAAASVAGVAAVVAAVSAGTVFSPDVPNNGQCNAPSSKLSAAIASAAALVASHCVEMAHVMGARREQILTVIRSAVNTQTAGDIMTLTAGAATALRGAATLSARIANENKGAALTGENKESSRCQPSSALAFVSNGGQLLKRTRKGILHWKQVSIYINSSWQVVVKMKSTHMAGTFVKKKKSVVTDVCSDVPVWPGREAGDCGEQRAYFGIRTPERLIEFECRSKCEKQKWIEGIRQMLDCHANMNIVMPM